MKRKSGDDLLTPGEAADYLGVSTRTLGRWAGDKRIPSQRTMGGHRRFKRSDVEKAALLDRPFGGGS